jgi:hypothetical protein
VVPDLKIQLFNINPNIKRLYEEKQKRKITVYAENISF